MKIAAVVVVHNEDVLLERWLRYYSKVADTMHVGDNDTTDGSIDRARKKFNFSLSSVVAAHYDVSTGQSTTNADKIATRNLLKTHDCVIVPDVDEFILPDPKKYKDLRDFIKKMKTDFATCNGFGVVQAERELPIDWDKPLLGQRTYWGWEKPLCKPIVTKIWLDWTAGKHFVCSMVAEKPNKDLILAHIREIDESLVRGHAPKKRLTLDGLEKIPERFRKIKI